MKKSICFLLALSLSTALASESKLYTVANVSIVTESGVTGFPIGTEVLPLKNGKYQIGNHVTEISPHSLTNDPAKVAAILSARVQIHAQSAEIERQAQIQARERELREAQIRAQEAEQAAARLRLQQQRAAGSSGLQTSGALGATIRK
jgi:hypothetical protein